MKILSNCCGADGDMILADNVDFATIGVCPKCGENCVFEPSDDTGIVFEEFSQFDTQIQCEEIFE